MLDNLYDCGLLMLWNVCLVDLCCVFDYWLLVVLGVYFGGLVCFVVLLLCLV